MTNTIFQPMPELTPEQHDALRDDIVKNGILVPVTVDQHGRIIDGHNRHAIATELGIDCPTRTVVVADDDEAMHLALTLNTARRHLTQEQKRQIIASELIRRPGDSDRAIARRVGCSPTTVGTVRAQRRAEAEASTRRAQHALSEATTALRRGLFDLILAGADPDVILSRLAAARDETSGEAHDALPDIRRVAAIIGMNFMFGATFNDITDVIDEVKADGVRFPLPQQMDASTINTLMDELFGFADRHKVSRLDTQPEAVGR